MQRLLLEKLLAWKAETKRKPLILQGVRQVGKTYLLQSFGATQFRKTHYFNFEQTPQLTKIFEGELKPQRLLAELSFHSRETFQVGGDLLIFDEIQDCPRALTSLKYFAEESPDVHLCAAGSLLGLHLNSSSFPVGKVSFLTLHPLSFYEFLLAQEDRALPYLQDLSLSTNLPTLVHEHLWTQLLHYFICGGLPEVTATYLQWREQPLEAFLRVRAKQDALLLAYYADMAKHSGKVNAMHIDRCFRALSAQLSQKQDGNAERFRFRAVVPGVQHYARLAGALDWLGAAGLALRVPIANSGLTPAHAYTKENAFKLLLFDCGLLGKLSGLAPETLLAADYGTYKGYFAENFVAQELQSAGYAPLYCWQEGKSELEFLLEDAGQVLPVEVKAGANVRAQSLRVFAEKYKPTRLVLFSGRPLRRVEKYACELLQLPLYLAGFLPQLLRR